MSEGIVVNHENLTVSNEEWEPIPDTDPAVFEGFYSIYTNGEGLVVALVSPKVESLKQAWDSVAEIPFDEGAVREVRMSKPPEE